MSNNIIMAVFSLLSTVGMVLVITWGMSAAGPRRSEYGLDKSEHIHSRDMASENLFLIDAADGEPAARKFDCVGEKPFGDRSINPGLCILTQLDVSNRRQVAQLVNNLILKDLVRLKGRGTNISC